MVHPSSGLHVSANPELVHNQTSRQTSAPKWILRFLHFQRRHPHPGVQAGCGEAWWCRETLYLPCPPALTEQQHPSPSLGSDGTIVRGLRVPLARGWAQGCKVKYLAPLGLAHRPCR